MLSRQRKMRRRAKFGRGRFEDSCVLSRLFRRCCEVSATRGLVHAWISTRASMVLRNCHNFHDFRRLAKRRLPGPIFDYIDGAADEETTHRRNTKAFESCDLVPSVPARGWERRSVRYRHGPEARVAGLLLSHCLAAPVPPSG